MGSAAGLSWQLFSDGLKISGLHTAEIAQLEGLNQTELKGII